MGVTVQIGLDKACKLSAVFGRYVEYCNEQHPRQPAITTGDLEFLHTHVLAGGDTAEAAALMKNDRIAVRREQSRDRAEEEVRDRVQRDSDKEYFQQLRQLLPTQTSSGRTSVHAVQEYADIVLDCRGVVLPPSIDGTSRTIKCHAALINRRCPWLGNMIAAARQENARRSVVTVTEEIMKEPSIHDEEEDFEMMQQIKVNHPVEAEPAAAQIENDDDEQVNMESFASGGEIQTGGINGDDDDYDFASFSTDATRRSQATDHLVWISIQNHSPEAVKLLLEYCYCNRVVPLGCEAFMMSCKTKPQYKKLQGPVPPYSLRPTRWPNNGYPTISCAVALAGIRLAEEAGMSRLSLMCEIAAVQLVDHATAVDALAECEAQRRLTGNPLPRLRKAAMDIVLRANHSSAVGLVGHLKDALTNKGPLLVPTLMTGTMEAMEEVGAKKKKHLSSISVTGEKRDWRCMAYAYFEKFDKMDAVERDRERRGHRGGFDADEGHSAMLDGDEMWARQMSLKRMSHNLGGALGNVGGGSSNRVVAIHPPPRGGARPRRGGEGHGAVHRRGSPLSSGFGLGGK